MSEISLDGFTVKCNRGIISLSKDGTGSELSFSSGEADLIKELIGLALSMEQLPSLPEHIYLQLFQMRFHADDTLTLCTTDDREGELPFSWSEGDTVFQRVDDG